MSKRVNQKQRLALKKNKSYNNKKRASSLAKQMGFIMFMLAMLFIFSPTKTSAATISPAAGDFMANNSDGICQLEEALGNINDSARTNADCVEVGTYGVNDTINLPSGTIENLGGSGYFGVYNSVRIIGQGQGQSIVKDYQLNLSGSGLGSNVLFQNFTIRNQDGIQASGLENLSLVGVEVNGQDSYDGSGGGGFIGLQTSEVSHLNIQDSYFHDFALTGSSAGIFYSSQGEESSLNIERTTFSKMRKGIVVGAYAGSGVDGVVVDATLKNNTFSDIGGSEAYNDGSGLFMNDFGIGISAASDGNDFISTVNYTTINNTFSNKLPNTISTAILEDAWGGNDINHVAQNDLYAVGNADGSANYRQMSNGDGGNYSTSSNGGNLSSDNSLSSFLNQSSDKHNQTSLASFLGDLADNGGPVPTQALLENSPAIDAGTSVAGMTTDARGESRPKGAGFDVGAYESAFGENGGGNNNQPNPGQIKVTTPGGSNGNNGSSVVVTGTPTIAVRPTFTGVATPNSKIVVTVNSDPVTCTTTSDGDGNWSCTLDEDLEPGQHSVTVEVRDPDTDELIDTFGPYTVNVLGDSTTTITNKNAGGLADTGQNIAVISGISGIVLATGAILLARKDKLKNKFKRIFNR